MDKFELYYFPGGGVLLRGPGSDIKLNAAGAARLYAGLDLLSAIASREPSSVYSLAKQLGLDVSNTRKSLSFMERLGLLIVDRKVNKGRPVKTVRLRAESITVHLTRVAKSPARRPAVLQRRYLAR